MYIFALALARIPDTLPELVYACMSGLNAGTVGVVASSAVLLSEGVLKARTPSEGEGDDGVGVGVLRIVLILAACVSVGYEGKDIWFFPSVMVGGAMATLVYGLCKDWSVKRETNRGMHGSTSDENRSVVPVDGDERTPSGLARNGTIQRHQDRDTTEVRVQQHKPRRPVGARVIGISLIIGFFLVFTAVNVMRVVYDRPPVLYKLFSNLFLAG